MTSTGTAGVEAVLEPATAGTAPARSGGSTGGDSDEDGAKVDDELKRRGAKHEGLPE